MRQLPAVPSGSNRSITVDDPTSASHVTKHEPSSSQASRGLVVSESSRFISDYSSLNITKLKLNQNMAVAASSSNEPCVPRLKVRMSSSANEAISEDTATATSRVPSEVSRRRKP